MFRRLTPEARDVIVEAEGHALRLGHGWVGCEHLLMAVAASGTPAGALLVAHGVTLQVVETAVEALIGTCGGNSDDRAALAILGIDLDDVRAAAERTFGAGALRSLATSRGRRGLRRTRRTAPCGATAPGRLTPRAKRCLELALREALCLKHDHVGVEHLALSLLARDDTVAWKVLGRLGVVPGELSSALREAMRRSA